MKSDSISPVNTEKEKTYVVKNLQQAKILTDPFRLKILKEFVEEPRTTKQVADRLGEKPTRLYRHVDALRHVGLLELKHERPKRGTVERYLQAVATRFAVDPGLFESDGGSGGRREMINAIFQEVQTDAENAIATMRREGEDQRPLVAKFQGRGTPSQFRELRRKITKWLDECQAEQNNAENEDHVEFGGLVTLYVTREGPRTDL